MQEERSTAGGGESGAGIGVQSGRKLGEEERGRKVKGESGVCDLYVGIDGEAEGSGEHAGRG